MNKEEMLANKTEINMTNKNEKLLKELIEERDRTRDSLEELLYEIDSEKRYIPETEKAFMKEQAQGLTKYLVALYGRIGYWVE